MKAEPLATRIAEEMPPQRFDAGETGSMLVDFLDLVVRLSGARAGAIRVPTADGASLRLLAAIGLSNEICARDAVMPASCGMCGAALQSSLTRQATAAIGCTMREGAADPAFSGRAVAVPLDHRERPIGVLNLFFSDGQDPPAGITRLLRPFGQLIGLALENEKLTRENLQARLEAERQAMAADVHDALAQSLTFVRMRMTLLDTAIGQQDCFHAHKYCADVSDELRNAHGRLREMISMYRAGISRGLLPSLRELAAAFRRRTGARLTIEREAGELRVVVEDDGCGPDESVFDPRCAGRLTEAGHHGLQIMRERAGRAGGRLAINALPGGGTRVKLTIDLAGA